ncbi:uncharacterized protein C10orf95-like [Neophocaena asiaeorientalis asiaeorientalis]|uniref:Uncharacterized protein C10orf95-like n=1 Tax=Neophocaena asiaeorientalis asiaeorientalis TaxID=1706337 RepID=A0A341C8R8_NEOAA|nr:uncharacterized protein C10orf95-like [Neophocaena asiaeorientalis asiaeorientalis]
MTDPHPPRSGIPATPGEDGIGDRCHPKLRKRSSSRHTHAPQTRPAPAQQPRRAQHRCPDAFTHNPTRPPQGDRSPSSCAAPPAPVAANSVLSPYPHSPHSPRRCAAPCPGPASRGNCALSLAKAHPAIELVTSNRQRRTLPRGAARGKRKGLEHKLRSSKATVDLCKKLEIRRAGEPQLRPPQQTPTGSRAPLGQELATGWERKTAPVCALPHARRPAAREALCSQWGGAPCAGGGAVTRAPRDPARGLRPGKPEAAAVCSID